MRVPVGWVAAAAIGSVLACSGIPSPSGTPAPAPVPADYLANPPPAEEPPAGGVGSPAGELVPGPIATDHFDGCGCLLADQGSLYFGADVDGRAWVNVGGPDLELQRVGDGRTGPEVVGDTFDETYRGSGLTLTVHWKVTRVCGEECESVYYDATLDLAEDPRTGTKKVHGSCGC